MGRRSRRRASESRPATVEYTDPAGNVLALRQTMSAATRAQYLELAPGGAATLDDAWRRRREFIFERLAVSWQIAGLPPLTSQKELLARYRMASVAERDWLDATIRAHVTEHFPELAG